MANTAHRQPTSHADRTPLSRGPLDLTSLVRAEYVEMPGLCLTVAQAARLWNVSRDECQRSLDALTLSRFLYRSGDRYLRMVDDGLGGRWREHVGTPRPRTSPQPAHPRDEAR